MTDPENFMKVWNESENVSEAAIRLGMKPKSASTMAYTLRSLGWNIKMFPKFGRKISVKEDA